MHLADCFTPLIAYVAYFRSGAAERQTSFEQIRADVTRLLGESEESARRNGFPLDEYDLGRFMVCAWVDEEILASGWAHSGLWQREQLQRIYYNTFNAGVEVFEKLNNLGFHQRETREIFYLCLCLGFKGRFVKPGDELLLEQLKNSNLKILLGSSVGMPAIDRGDLFPGAYPLQKAQVGEHSGKFQFTPLLAVALLGPLLLFGGLYLIYHFTLGNIAGKLF